MPEITAADLRSRIASRTLDPVYVLTGPDDREKLALASLFGDAIEPELRAFNLDRFYGGDSHVRIADVVAAAQTLPMMTARRIVIVLRTERLLAPKRRAGEGDDGESEPGAEDPALLVEYLQQPSQTTTLVFVLPAPEAGSDANKRHALSPIPGNTRIAKALARAATVVTCGEFGTEREVFAWLGVRLREAGIPMARDAAQRLVDLAGGDPARFRESVERVITFAAGEPEITLDHVEEAIVAHESSTDDWALVRAVERGDAVVALRELRARLERGDVVFRMLGQLGSAIRTPPPRGRFPPARLPRAVDALFRTDQALKSSGGDPTVLMERLVVELCLG